MATDQQADEYAIKCPHCDHVVDIETICESFTTYHGEGPPGEHDCAFCESPFFIRERVSRTWQAGRTAKEADDL